MSEKIGEELVRLVKIDKDGRHVFDVSPDSKEARRVTWTPKISDAKTPDWMKPEVPERSLDA